MIRALRFIAGLLVTMGVVLGMSMLSQQPAGAVPVPVPPGGVIPNSSVPGGGGPAAGGTGGGGTGTADTNTASRQAACEGSGGTWDGASCTTPGSTRTLPGTIQQIANILIFLMGSIAVLMVIIGGVRYGVAQGDNAAITAAKNTILYAIVGVVVASAAYGIVNFVLTSIK